jgi:hypothetical protein
MIGILFVLMVSPGQRNVKGSSIIIAVAAVITLLFLPLTVSSNNNALLQSQSAFAQVQDETDFLPYLNPIHGIFMQYPSDWIASTSALVDYTDLVAFYSPLQNLSDTFPARLTISVVTYGQNVSLPEYTDFVWTRLNQSEGVDVRSSSEVTVAGYPGHRLVITNQPQVQNTTLIFYQVNTWTTIGNKVYLLTYEAEEATFNDHLPEVNQMLGSLTIQQEAT